MHNSTPAWNLKVIWAIATKNRQVALNLLSNKVWHEFQRLAIAQPPLNTPEKFIAACTPSQNMPRRTRRRANP